MHAQFILDENRPFIVEVSRRCPGDLYSLLIEYSTGYQYAAKYASYFVQTQFDASRTGRRHVLRHTVSSVDDEIFGGLKLPHAKALIAFFPLQSMGQDLAGLQKTRAGILFCEAENHQALLEDYKLFVSRNAYHLA
ncbi:MAG: hypothetical protein JO347_00460 [Candidatus Eremiobacteraeota bacterium]|nr:hypothetical protein [Candidatus Eremiobacteraeota bacterium]